MNKSRIVKWIAVLFVALALGAVVGGGIVYATSASQTDNPAVDDPDSGILVAAVVPNWPAAKAGVVRGDILLQVDGQPVNSSRELQRYLAGLEAGDEVELTVLHGDDERTLIATLDERYGRPYLGLRSCVELPLLEEMEALGDLPHWDELPITPEDPTATITRVVPDSPADQAGLESGDRVVAVDGRELDTEHDLADLITALEPGDTVTLEIERSEEERVEVTVELGEHPEREGVAYLGVEYLPSWHVEWSEGPPLDIQPFKEAPFFMRPDGREESPLFVWPDGRLERGAVISRVTEGGPAAEAGLDMGDVITGLDGEPVEGPQDLVDAIAEREPGDTVTLTVFDSEEEEERDVEVVLAEHPENEGQAYLGVALGGFFRFRSFEGEFPPLDELPFAMPVPSPEDIPFLTPPEGELIQGAIVRRVAEDSPASASGLAAGDVIIAVDGEPVASPQDLVETIAQREPGDAVTFTVLGSADEEEREVEITLAERPEKEGQPYLGVVIGGFVRSRRFQEQDEPHWMQPLERFFEGFHHGFSLELDGEHKFEFEWGPDGHLELPFELDLDFNLFPDLFQEAPCCTQDVTA
jgi:S1-C subfamily serine protease